MSMSDVCFGLIALLLLMCLAKMGAGHGRFEWTFDGAHHALILGDLPRPVPAPPEP